MSVPPTLLTSDVSDPWGLVLMLHGGKARDNRVVGRSAAWRRSRWMMSQIEGELHRARVEVWLLRYAVRGWNGGAPVDDARWAMEQVRERRGELPVVLLGHSMGGRTAAAVADDPLVTGMVGLAPWLPPDEPVEALTERGLVAAHGRRDKITSALATRAFVERARPLTASAEYVDMGHVGHYMFRNVAGWNQLAVKSALRLLDPRVSDHP